MTIPDWLNWTDLTLYHFLAIGGAVLVLVALLLHFTPVARLKMPAVLLGVVGGLGTGIALGVLSMASLGYHFNPPPEETTPALGQGAPPRMQGPPGMPGRGMPPGGGGGGGRGMGGGRGPNPKAQLATLVTKLDQLSGKPLHLALTPEQKKKVDEQLQKLDEEKELKEDDAKKRLDTLLTLLKDQRETLEAAGYRWPGAGQGGGGRPPADQPNPFTEEANAHHLKSLRAYLEEKK